MASPATADGARFFLPGGREGGREGRERVRDRKGRKKMRER